MSQYSYRLPSQQQQPATTKHNPYEELLPADCGPKQFSTLHNECGGHDGGSSGNVSPQCCQTTSPPQHYNATENSSSVGNSTPAPQSPLHDTNMMRNGMPPVISLGTPSVSGYGNLPPTSPPQHFMSSDLRGTPQPFLSSPPQQYLDRSVIAFQHNYNAHDGSIINNSQRCIQQHCGGIDTSISAPQQCLQNPQQWRMPDSSGNVQCFQSVSPPQQYATHITTPPQQYQQTDCQVPLPTAITPLPQAPPISLGAPSVGQQNFVSTPVNQHLNAPLPAAINLTPPFRTPPSQIQTSVPFNVSPSQMGTPISSSGMPLSPNAQPMYQGSGSFGGAQGINSPIVSPNGAATVNSSLNNNNNMVYPQPSTSAVQLLAPQPAVSIPQSQYVVSGTSSSSSSSDLPVSSYTVPTTTPVAPKPEAPPAKAKAKAPSSKKKVRTNYPSCGGRKIFVGQLPKNVTRTNLVDLLEEFGEIDDVKILHDKKTGQGTGAAFIVYKSPESARTAVRQMHQKIQLNGMSTRIQLRLAEGEFDSSTDLKLFVGQVPPQTTESHLQVIFDHQDLLECAVPLKDGKPRGCAFIRYSSKEAADLAIANFHEKLTLDGSQAPISVTYAFSEADKRRRGRTGGHTAQSSNSSSGYSSQSSAGRYVHLFIVVFNIVKDKKNVEENELF